MAGKTITSANSVLMLAAAGLFATPQKIQGYAADAAFAFDEVENAETTMGIDGKLSAGWVAVEIPQKITLQADSVSMFFFDQVNDYEQTNREKLWLSGSLYIPSVGRKWSLVNGILKRYTPAPEAGKTLKPRTFGIVWESAPGAPA
jgi:hypothetical protein